MDIGVVAKENAEVVWNILRGFVWLKSTNVYVGVPSEGGARNAGLLYLHTNGVPSRNIPPRPTIEPALAQPDVASQIKDQLMAGMKQALAGNIAGAEICYGKAGMIGATAAQNMFGSGDLAPNAPSTIAKKGSSKPLIDTGVLRQSVTYVIRKE